MQDLSERRAAGRPGIVCYVVGVAALASVAGVMLGRRWGSPELWALLFFWALHGAAESTAIQLPAGTLSGGFLVLMTAAFAVSPATAAAVGFLSAFSLLEWRTARAPIRMLFNAGQGAIYTGGASAVFWSVRAALGPSTWVAMLATIAAATAALCLNTGLVAGVLALERRRKLRSVWQELLWPAPNYMGFAFAALMVSALYRQSGALSVVFLITPLLVIRAAHRGYIDLKTAHRRTLRAFVRAVELKDPYTRGHSERVAEVALELFRELGVDEARFEGLHEGALLHDLGKVAVSGRILTKRSSLTADEYDAVKIHPAVGAAIIKEIDFLADRVPLVMFHHERIDGTGYPWGLKGEAIPFDARVLAVADAFDALTADRPFRPAMTQDQAMEEIRRSTGTQLDARAVAALERVLAGGHTFSRPLPVAGSLSQRASLVEPTRVLGA